MRLTRGNRGHAEDVVQETLFRAWRHPAVLSREPDSARAWLYRVAHNIVIDDWRSTRSRHEIPVEDATRIKDAGPRAISESFDTTDELLQGWLVADAMRSLSPDHRTVLVECYYRDRSIAETARRLDVPEGTVKSRLHYGLRALRLALQESGVGT